ncbi:MAG: 30S ribosomal protein S20 [Candidatus Uhrbacteria bacterium]|nr:30S ribosomal protein S20 [Candidatus Uhrbacteria bacterium]
MPNLRNAKKALRQSEKRADRNKIVREEIHSMRRHFRKLLEAGKLEDATKMVPDLYKKLDKAVVKNVFKKNKSARIKSRLSVNLAKIGGKTKAVQKVETAAVEE